MSLSKHCEEQAQLGDDDDDDDDADDEAQLSDDDDDVVEEIKGGRSPVILV